jgi:YafQ family addiction module toxin component
MIWRRESQLPEGKTAARVGSRLRNVDHSLQGEWKDFRDCHVRPDLILIYRKPDDKSLELVRLGSHSELGF